MSVVSDGSRRWNVDMVATPSHARVVCAVHYGPAGTEHHIIIATGSISCYMSYKGYCVHSSLEARQNRDHREGPTPDRNNEQAIAHQNSLRRTTRVVSKYQNQISTDGEYHDRDGQ